jgi:hypothetical protein
LEDVEGRITVKPIFKEQHKDVDCVDLPQKWEKWQGVMSMVRKLWCYEHGKETVVL